MTFDFPYGATHCSEALLHSAIATGISVPLPDRPAVNISIIGALAMKMLAQKEKLNVYALSLYKINIVIDATKTKEDWN